MTRGKQALGAFVALTVWSVAPSASAQPATPTAGYRLGVYLPTAPVGSSDEARASADALAAAITKQVGARVSARVHFRYRDLIKARPHFAVVPARCVATGKGMRVLARARLGTATSRRWGLYAKSAARVPSLRGAKVVHPAVGCSDRAFLGHTILEGELPVSFFGPLIARRTAPLAADAVRDRGVAKLAFLPSDSATGLVPLYETAPTPGPALVALRPLSTEVRAGATRAAAGYTASSGITGYQTGGGDLYKALAARMRPRTKRPQLAPPTHHRASAAKRVKLPAPKPAPLPVLHWMR